jgi:hypothetical protein
MGGEAVAKIVSDWRREAEAIVRATLALLPDGATITEKRRALRQAYPWGAREHHPYRIWCDVARKELGITRLSTGGELGPFPDPTPTGNRDLDRARLTLARAPDDALALCALADVLEEQGDQRAEAIRTLTPSPENVASRLWPGCTFVAYLPRGATDHVEEIRHRGCRVATVASIRHEIAGAYLLTDPAVTRAAAVERAALALALLSPH